jgi:formylmethanofuran dehydrogenase subunit D
MAEILTLIAGRSSKQGTSLNVGKLKAEYQEVTTTLEMNEADMARLGLQEGDQVRLRTDTGQAVVRCRGRKAADLPAGLIFLAYGPASSQLMGGDTAGTGMPLSKDIDVEVERLTS